MKMYKSLTRGIAVLGALIAWFALGARLWLSTEILGSFIGAVGLLLGFFTIITNITVALALTHAALKPHQHTGWGSVRSRFIVVVAIVMVGLVYHIALRGYWDFYGFELVVDKLLHYVLPTLFVVFWFMGSHGHLMREDVWFSMVMPLIYSLYAFIRGAFTGWYPYPFMDASKLSLVQLAINMAVLYVAFLLTGIFFFGMDRFLSRQSRRE